MKQPIRTIAAYYEAEGRSAVGPNLAQELCEEAIGRLALHVGSIAVNWEGLHIPEEPLDALSPHLDAIEAEKRHLAFFTKGAVEYNGDSVQGIAIPIGEGGWMRSRFIVQVPRVSLGRRTWCRALTLHEMGHSFGVIDHCLDVDCIMHEDLYAPDAKRKMAGEPFCGNCADELSQASATILRRQTSEA